MSVTERFQQLWSNLLWERTDDTTFDEKIELLQEFLNTGADANHPFGSHLTWNPETPLYYLIYVYGGRYYTLNDNQCDQLLHLLLQNGVIPDEKVIRAAARRCLAKVLEQLLYFAREEDIRLTASHSEPEILEVMLGFPSVHLDQEISLPLACRVDLIPCTRMVRCLPIEKCLIDYALSWGDDPNHTKNRNEIMLIMKKNQTPQPRLELLTTMLDLINCEEARKHFRDAYEYWKSL